MELRTGKESSTSVTTATAEVEEPIATIPVPIKARRRNLGRQARKRRKKYLEIEAAASAFVAAAAAGSVETKATERAGDGHQEGLGSDSITTASKSTTTILPTDRGYVLDDVRKRTVLSEDDRRDLIRQLGYLPGNALRVVARVEDAFSPEDLERIFAAAAVAPKTTTARQSESATATDASNTNVSSNLNNNNDSENKVTTDTNGTTTINANQTNERRAKNMTSVIRTIIKEPLVIKLYPLVLRDESSSTKRRRKRRREEVNNNSTNHHGTNKNETAPANANANATIPTTGTGTDPARNAIGVAVADSSKSAPLMEPFPTIYWVTHPLIKALISKLELDRVNVQFEKRLLDEDGERNQSGNCNPTAENCNNEGDCHSSAPLASMRRAHKSYGKERRGLLSSRDMEYVKGRRWYDVSSSNGKNSTAPFSDGCGVAGIRNPKAVKCLHSHAAHYWSGNDDNIVGYWVWERLKSGDSFFRKSDNSQNRDGIQNECVGDAMRK